ncbi:MAG TPA: reverse transcriptase family protein [Phycisphaerae bacterium]|nr:reverse transcriptase family protein [Phycisphaerae bacterium]
MMILALGCWSWVVIVVGVIYIGICLKSRSLTPIGWWHLEPLDTPGHWQPRGESKGDVGYPVPKPNQEKAYKPSPRNRNIRQSVGDPGRLNSFGMPVFHSTDDLLRWLNLDFRSFLALADPSNRIRPGKTNYVEWHVPKKSTGVRIICSPKPRLKSVQTKIKEGILDRAPVHGAAHGFVRNRNIVSNASAHVGKDLILNLDLRNFFDHVTYPQVVGIFRWLGYNSEVSRCLAQLCTYRPNLGPINKPRGEDDQIKCVWRAFRHAVQGAPTSPMLANLAVHRMDRRLSGLAKRFDATYTRYADDLTFSGDESFKRGMIRFLKCAKVIIRQEGFRLNHRKLRFMRPSQRQEVTGVIVNEKTNARREDYDRLKAIIYNARKAGSLESQNREGHSDFKAHLLGRIGHISKLNPARGQKLLDSLRGL